MREGEEGGKGKNIRNFRGGWKKGRKDKKAAATARER